MGQRSRMSETISNGVAARPPERLSAGFPDFTQWVAARFLNDPKRAVLLVILAHCVCYGLIALLSQHTLPLDVIEQIGWSRDPQWVYFKHPPLPAWTLALVLGATDNWLASAAVLGPITTAVALGLVWLLSVRIVDPARAAIAVLLTQAMVFFNFDSLEFNHNLIQLPLWLFIAYAGHRAWREGKSADWMLLGLAAALGMLGKYSTALLVVSLAAAFLIDSEGRKKFRSPGPWLAIGTAVLLIAPHLVALAQIDFSPLRFPLERARTADSWIEHVTFPVQWLAAQSLDVSFALLLAMLLLLPVRSGHALPPKTIAERDRKFITVLFAGPVILSETIQAIGGFRFLDMWGMPMWVLLGPVIVILTSHKSYGYKPIGRFALAWIGIFALGIAATSIATAASPYLTRKDDRAHYPSANLVKTVHDAWRRQTRDAPLKVVVGDCWLSGIFAAYDPDHPSVMTDGDRFKSPWITNARIKQFGAVLLWSGKSTAKNPLMSEFPAARLQATLVLPFITGARVPPATIGWAILPPGPRSLPAKVQEIRPSSRRLTSPDDPCARPPG